MTNRYLGIYLNDHLAGAVAGVELARRTLTAEREGPIASSLRTILQEIEEDQKTLERFMERLNVVKNPLKTRAAWAAEKVGRLKLNGNLLSRSPLSGLIELEVLQLGVEGKVAMWQTLKQLGDDRFAELDFDLLIERGRRQRDEVERLRMAAATRALQG